MFPAKSVAVAVMVFEPWFKTMLFAVKVPFDIVAVVPSTVTIAWLSLIVPDTVIVQVVNVDSSCGDVMATTGATVSSIIVWVVGIDTLPSPSMNLA